MQHLLHLLLHILSLCSYFTFCKKFIRHCYLICSVAGFCLLSENPDIPLMWIQYKMVFAGFN